MSAETLRRAVERIREDSDDPFMLAVADMLDHRAAKYEADVARLRGAFGDHANEFVVEVDERMLAVAHTYLGGAS